MTGSRSSAPLAKLCRQLDQRIDEIARRLLGEPNRPMSSRTQLRFGRHGSLAVEIAGAKRGQWYDHEAGRGGDLVELVRHRLSLDRDDAHAWTLGIASPAVRRVAARRIVATYDYRDENGALLFQVVRYAPKTFRQRRPGADGGWSWRVKGVRQVPYRLPELLAAGDAPVFVVEGEKDADRLAGLGLVARRPTACRQRDRRARRPRQHGRRLRRARRRFAMLDPRVVDAPGLGWQADR